MSSHQFGPNARDLHAQPHDLSKIDLPGVSNFVIPTVREQKGGVERTYDLYSRLLEDRIVMLGEAIDDRLANLIVGQLLFLNGADKNKDINLYINSPGGSVTAAMAIYDTIQSIEAPVATYCLGLSASAGAVLLAAGHHGKRHALPNSTIMIHQPRSGGTPGPMTDQEIALKYGKALKLRLNEILSLHSGQPLEKVSHDCERDFYMTAQEAKDYGLIDQVIETKKIATLKQMRSAGGSSGSPANP